MRENTKALKDAVETLRMPEGMGERLLQACLAASSQPNAEREILRDPPAGGRGGRAPRKWWGSLIAACVTVCVVSLAGFGLWSAHRDTPTATPPEELPEESVPSAAGEAPSSGLAGTESTAGSEPGAQEPPEDEPSVRLELEGMEALEELREMVSFATDEELENYLRQRGLLFYVDREGLVAFLEMLENLPYLPILPGEPVSIACELQMPLVSFLLEGANGDRAEVNYEIYFDNPDRLMTFLQDLAVEAPSLIDPFSCCDGRVTVYVEARSRTDDGQDFVIWHALVDGILVRVCYYTEHPESVVAEELWGGLTVQSVLATAHPEGPEEEAPGDPPATFLLDSLDALAAMHELASTADDATLEDALSHLWGGAAYDRETLNACLQVVDALPYLSLLEGEVTSLEYNPEWKTARIVTEGPGGDWVRLTFYFYIEDARGEVERWRDPLFEQPIVCCDGRVTVYLEWRTKGPAGDRLQWWGEADGLFFNAEYHTAHLESVAAEDVFAASTLHLVSELP